MRSALRIGSIFGIAIYVHFTYVLIFALVTFSLVAHFAGQFPTLSQALQVGVGVVASILFFSSVLFHELAHSWLARSYGYTVRWSQIACNARAQGLDVIVSNLLEVELTVAHKAAGWDLADYLFAAEESAVLPRGNCPHCGASLNRAGDCELCQRPLPF